MLNVHVSYLRQLRRKCRLSMTEAAKCLGISKSTLSRYENGKTNIKASVLLHMADVYNVQIEVLLKEVET